MALIDDIRSRVMQVLNELMPGDDAYNDILSFDMDNCINEAGRRVALAAPLYLLTPHKSTSLQVGSSSVTITGHVVRVVLPQDYLRLFFAKLPGWEHPVYGNELITPEHSLYARQANKMTAGGVHKPVVAIVGGYLELYSLAEGTEQDQFIEIEYFPNADISKWGEDTEVIGYPSGLIEPVVWQTVSLLFNIMEEHDNAAFAQNRCNELLSLTRAL